MSFQLSKYQQDIINHIATGKGSLFVEAVAGSSKTFTIVEASKYLQNKRAVFLAFNKHIADELKRKLPPSFDVRTINSLGYKMWREYVGNCRVDADKIDNIIDELRSESGDSDYGRFRWSIRHIVSAAKMNAVVPDTVDGFEDYKRNGDEFFNEIIYENENVFNQLDEVATQDKREYEIAFSYYAERVVKKAKKVLEKSIENQNEIDFDDQIYLPVIHNVEARSFEYILCDESQDLSPIQITLIQRVTDKNSIVIGVGDVKQSIYQFRGADEQAISKFKQMFACQSLPLSICYRCPKDIVKKAQGYNSQIECWDQAITGKVNEYGHDYSLGQFVNGHTILSRFNAPLLDMAIRLINHDVQFMFEGRTLGKELISLVRSFKEDTVFGVANELEGWYETKKKFLESRQRLDQLINIKDKYFCLSAICSRLKADQSVHQVIGMIEKIFSGGIGVKLSTIHKSKGSEADVVWILDFDKLPYKHKEDAQEIDQQEINLVYVATTRAKKEMNFILSREEFRQEYYGRKEHNAKRLVDNKVTKIDKQVTMAQTIKKILDK